MSEAWNELMAVWRGDIVPGREFSESGGKVVGYLCDNLPEELLIAADILPIRVRGTGSLDLPLVKQFLDPKRNSRVISPQFVPPLAEALMGETGDYMDRVIIPHTRKAVQELNILIDKLRKGNPELNVPEVWFLDRAYGPDSAASRFNRNQLALFRRQVEEWTGQPLSDDKIAAAIALTNEARALLREFNAWRQQPGSPVSGADAVAIMGCSMIMPKARFVELLRDVLTSKPDLPTQDGRKRLFVGGSPFDHAGAYAALEKHGAVVVAEDHCWGARCGDFAVREDGDPFEMLAVRYHEKPACSIALPLERTVKLSTDRALASGADGAVFLVQPGDQLQLWETPDEIAVLEKAGMPVLHLHAFPYSGECNAETEEKIANFVASLTSEGRA